MGVITCTISGVTYLTKNDKSILADKTLEVRGVLTITIVDLAGAYTFQRGQPVIVSDSVTGPFYSGFIQSDQRQKYGPASAAVDHVLTCFDNGKYYFDKGANTKNYAGWYAGDIVVDFVQNGQPGQEGATVAAGLHRDSTTADFNTGILTNVVGTSNVDDGDLELAPAGSPVVITESTQADFATGTLLNTSALTSGLVPTPSSAIQLIGTITNVNGGRASYKIWVGSKTVAASDTFNYEIWLSSSCPSGEVAVDFMCSDGTTLSGTGDIDVQGIDAAPINDVSGLATNTWYKRSISIADLSGKTISFVAVTVAATKPGTYTAYFRNIYLSSASGSPFFSTTATATQQNPPLQIIAGNFNLQTLGVVTTYGIATTGVPPTYVRYTPANSINAVNLLRSSVLNWQAILANNAGVSFRASYDGGITFLAASLNTNLPGLLPGASVVGKSVILEETLTLGTDPTTPPTLYQTVVDVEPAAITTTRNDFTKTYSTSTDWNSGTLTNVVVQTSSWPLASSAITLNGLTRSWQDGNTASQTAWAASGAIVRLFHQAMELTPANVLPDTDCKSQLGFAGNWQNFTAGVDIVSYNGSGEAGFVYRTTYWDTQNNTYAYTITMSDNALIFAKSSNSSSPSSTTITTAANSISGGNTHRLRIVVSGTSHKAYLDGIQYISSTDSTFTATGNLGLRVFCAPGGGLTARFANFGIVSVASGTWLSPSHSLTSVGTYGSSSIVWRADVASSDAIVLVETSVDGGSTYQTVTNNGDPIPNLTAGQSLSGVTLRVRITLTTQEVIAIPAVSGLRITVSNSYGTASGTRSTKPMGIDYVDRADQAGFGTASDGQAWTPIGTATAAVSSNKLTISNTTGDFFEQLGSRTDDDMDMTVPFMLSASTMTGGMTLRYVDGNNYYKLQASTTSIDIVKKVSGVSYTLQSVASTLVTNTLYYMRFRVADQLPVLLYGRIWQAGTLEDQTSWTVMTSD